MRIEFDIPEAMFHHYLDPVPIPEMARVRYDIPTPAAISDIGAAIKEQMERAGARDLVKPGQRIAVGVGSRGISRLPEIVAALVSELRALGADPFIIPTMGSHGGATAEGQREVLTHLGVTPERVGAPIKSQMEAQEIGRTPDGTPVCLDRLALAADGIIFVARVKPHTAFRGAHESGFAKMIAIGLGKQAGAYSCHAHGFSQMARVLPAVAEVALARAPIRFGLGVLENGYEQPFKFVILRSERMLAEEPALLEEAKGAMPRIPFDDFDVLVIDEIGKNISGDGADPNITGRYPTPDASGGPRVNKQVVLSLTAASGGNAMGIGTADITTVRLARSMSIASTYPNGLTSTVVGPTRLPMVLPSDRLAIAAALLTCNAVGRDPRLVRIKNTLRLDEFWISTGLLDEAKANPALRIITGLGPLQFDGEGNLPDLSDLEHEDHLPLERPSPKRVPAHQEAW